MASDYADLEQWLYDTDQAMPGSVRPMAHQIEASAWLARVKREAAVDAWDEGARWAYEEITGEPENRFDLAPGDNPHRAQKGHNG